MATYKAGQWLNDNISIHARRAPAARRRRPLLTTATGRRGADGRHIRVVTHR
jgi:hypothetical protein